ncbi:hypothetical protein CDD81_17 [Ophiocordyceps australis]|uniref:Uncharacterized protein n=1 Tax=Ophiocordyceps australis TaxID=1399860 RepID=A0A2C5XNE2_9HYPO|nr:hypothetical protein CDD81_17 [Ophiocordyceps australis]
MREPSLLNGAVAVAAAHYSRWHGTADTVSRKYLQTASKALFARLSDPVLVRSPITLASMLLHVSYEVFSGSPRWKGHYDAIRGWIASRGDCSDLDPFLKTWVCLLDTQSSLNLGQPAMLELEPWMDSSAPGSGSIDALFGCSSKLPKLMWSASRLYAASKANLISRQQLCKQAAELQTQIRATSMPATSQPGVSITCDAASTALTATLGIADSELQQRMVAAAELFRHASHIYVHRIVYGPEYALPPDLYASLEAGKQCLVEIPDALGPGANLGWCLVVLGAEMESVEDREYITSRWEALHRLGMYNTKNGQKIVQEVWKHGDLVRQGWATAVRWQDIMQHIGESQILV